MVYTQMYLMLCISSIGVYSCMRNTSNSHFLHFEKKLNVSPVTVISYSFVVHDFMILYCNAYNPIISYSNFERNYFVF